MLYKSRRELGRNLLELEPQTVGEDRSHQCRNGRLAQPAIDRAVAALKLFSDARRSIELDDFTVIAAIAPDPPLIELSEAAKHGLLFERAFGRRLQLDFAS